MRRTLPPHSPEFRRQMADLVHAGRNITDLAREFDEEPIGFPFHCSPDPKFLDQIVKLGGRVPLLLEEAAQYKHAPHLGVDHFVRMAGQSCGASGLATG